MKLHACIFTTIVSIMAFTGCNLGTSPENNTPTPATANAAANTITQGVTQLSDASLEVLTLPAERFAADTVVITINGVLIKWRYSEAISSWIRESKWTVNKDSMVCYDTVCYMNSSNQGMKIPTLATTAKIKHSRAINGSYLSVPYSYLYDMTVTIDKSTPDTFFVFNGSLTGTYNNTQISKTTITDVKRKFIRFFTPHLGYPVSGTIDIILPEYTIKVTFGGLVTAQAVITRKSDGKTWIITINAIIL
jgi:hypothetical protein